MKKEIKLSFDYKKMAEVCKSKVAGVFWFLGRHAFLFMLIFILLGIGFGEFLFYQDIYLLKFKQPEYMPAKNNFQENVYSQVLQEWQVRQKAADNASQENYSSPF